MIGAPKSTRDCSGIPILQRVSYDTWRLVAAALALRRGEFNGNASAAGAAKAMAKPISRPSMVTDFFSKFDRLKAVGTIDSEAVVKADTLSQIQVEILERKRDSVMA